LWRFEVFKDPQGYWRWRLVQKSALIVAESIQCFKRRVHAEEAASAAREELGEACIAVV
jgi:uncharacterized protein YegP (UPF0339 family)